MDSSIPPLSPGGTQLQGCMRGHANVHKSQATLATGDSPSKVMHAVRMHVLLGLGLGLPEEIDTYSIIRSKTKIAKMATLKETVDSAKHQWILSKLEDLSITWNWRSLSSHPSISWDIVQTLPDKPWVWKFLSKNPNITWDTVQANPDKPWDWKGLSSNENITWDIVQANPDKPWDWNKTITAMGLG